MRPGQDIGTAWSLRSRLARMVVSLVTAASIAAAGAPPASAFSPLKPLCRAASVVNGVAGKACTVAQNSGRIISVGKKLLGGRLAQAAKTAVGESGSATSGKASFMLALAAAGAWVAGGATFALHETAKVIGKTTSPQLHTTWFSSTYWRIAGIAAVLTLPFLFAAAVQALLHSDLALLARAALGYLPLAMLAVGVATPLTMLLLAASDQLSAMVAAAAGNASLHFLKFAGGVLAALTFVSRSPFLVFFVGLFTVAGAFLLWAELLMREVAVYVIVLMLPLAFAAFVWPARRVWAIRAVELLVALIVSKFAIVAVLALGGAALTSGAGGASFTSALAGFVLLVMAAFAPWVLLRLLPLAELASGAAGSLRPEWARVKEEHARAIGLAHGGEEWAISTTSEMRREAEDASRADDGAAGLRTPQAQRVKDGPQAPAEPGIAPSAADASDAEAGAEPAAAEAPAGREFARPPAESVPALVEQPVGQAPLDRDAVQALDEPDVRDQPRGELDEVWRTDFMSRPPVILGPQTHSPQPPSPLQEEPDRSGAEEQPNPPVDEPAEGRL